MIQRVCVVGTGLIGSSWAALFLARGLEVVATDPAPGAEQKLRDHVRRAWPQLTQLGLSPGAGLERLRFESDLAAAVTGIDFVQESGPERIDFKKKLFVELDALLPSGVIVASSSSGLAMSAIQCDCKHPQRCVIGHPFNPPHLMPLVELVGGRFTSAETIERAEAFYTAIGKRTIRVLKEVPGHVANRLQAALWREAVHLVEQGVVSVRDVDDAVSWGPGLRWGLMGPNLVFHLGGGAGGLPQFLTHLAGPFTRMWEDLGAPELTPAVCDALIRGVQEETAGIPIAELEAQRDKLLLQLIALRTSHPTSSKA